MGAFTLDEAVDIAAAPGDVWAYVMAHDDWRRPVVVSVVALDGDEMRVGSRYENKIRLMGITNTVINEITVFDPPRRLSWKQVNDDRVMTKEGNYILEASGTGTKFSIRGTYETSGSAAAFAPLVRLITRRIITNRLLPQLKAAIEA